MVHEGLNGEADAQAQRFLHHAAFITVFSTLFCLTLLGTHLALRAWLGLASDAVPAMKIAAIWLAAGHALFALPERTQSRLARRAYLVPLIPVGVLLLPILGWKLGGAAYPLFPVLSLFGTIGLLRRCRFTAKQWLFLPLAAAVYGCCFFLWVDSFQMNYSFQAEAPPTVQSETNPDAQSFYDRQANRILQGKYTEIHATNYHVLSVMREMALLGSLHKDLYYHLAIINMLQVWGEPTSGLDGFVRFPYNVGVHFWYATLGRLAGAEPVVTLPLGEFALIFPGIHWLFLLGALCMRRRFSGGSVFYVFAPLLALAIWQAAYDLPTFFLAVTSGPAILMLLAAFPCLHAIACRWWFADAAILPLMLLAALFTLLIGACKPVVGVVYAGACGYVLLRRYLSARVLLGVLLPAGLVAMFVVFTFLFPKWPINKECFDTHGMDRLSCHLFFEIFEVLPQFWVCLPVIAYFLLFPRPRSPGAPPLKRLNRELAFLFFIIGYVPLIYPSGGAMFFPPNAASWCILLLGCAHPSFEAVHWRALFRRRKRFFPDKDPAWLFASLAAAVLAVRIAQCTMVVGEHWQRIMLETRHYRDQHPTVLEQAIDTINAAPGERAGLAVLVPTTNVEFWSFGARFTSRSFYIPTLAGLPMLMGLPSVTAPRCFYDCELTNYSYPYYSADAVTGNPDDAFICAHARRQGITRVFILRENHPSPMNKTLHCR